MSKLVTKKQAAGANVDWNAVALATEIPRSYEIRLKSGGIIFKMYKPSEMRKIMNNPGTDVRSWKWESVKMVGVKK